MGTLFLISGHTSFCFYPWFYRVTTPQQLVSRGLCIFLAAILQYNKGSARRSTLSLVNWNLGVGGPTQSISTALGPYAMTSSQISSRPAWPNSINKYFITWPRLGFLRQQNCSKLHLAGPQANLAGPYGFFRPCSRYRERPSYGDFASGLLLRARAGPYGSYDKYTLLDGFTA